MNSLGIFQSADPPSQPWGIKPRDGQIQLGIRVSEKHFEVRSSKTPYIVTDIPWAWQYGVKISGLRPEPCFFFAPKGGHLYIYLYIYM